MARAVYPNKADLADPVRGAKRTAGVDAKVLDYINRHPGCTWRDIMVWRGCAIGTARSSVGRLVAAGHIAEAEDGSLRLAQGVARGDA